MASRARKFFDTEAALRRGGQSFVVATVVARRAPVSAHLGDRAIVFADGRMDGFVGGACSREIVRKQALDALRLRRPRLVSITPDPGRASSSDPEHVVVAMTCISEGAVDVYIEPIVPARRLVVVGTTPVAEALTRTALTLDFDVVRVVRAGEERDLEEEAAGTGFTVAPLESLESVLTGASDVAAVVASQGHYDEEALEAILKHGVQYVGLVASRKRGDAVKSFLAERGAARVDTIRNPAGLDLGARTAPEVALSILAEIVQVRPSQALTDAASEASRSVTPLQPESRSRTAIDPVCGMDVDIASATYSAEVDGTMYYFCCAQCRTRFTKEPARYLATRP